MFLLSAGSSTQRYISTTGDGVPADVLLRLQQENRRARFLRLNSGRKANRASPDDYDIYLSIPLNSGCGGSLRNKTAGSYRSGSDSGFLEKLTTGLFVSGSPCLDMVGASCLSFD